MNGTETIDPLARVRQRLVEAACGYDFKRRAWRCPSCRRRSSLRVRELPDGAIAFHCAARLSGARGCETPGVLESLGLSWLDVGPAQFRRERVA